MELYEICFNIFVIFGKLLLSELNVIIHNNKKKMTKLVISETTYS